MNQLLNSITDTFCDTPLWETNKTWDTPYPDFSPCFQKTVIQWLPCLFLVVMAPLHILIMSSNKSLSLPTSSSYKTKMVLALFLALLAVIDLLKSVFDYRTGGNECMVNVLSPIPTIFTMMLVMYLTKSERKHGVISSGTFFIYWLLSLVAQFCVLQSKLRAVIENGDYFTYEVVMPLTVFLMTVRQFAYTLFYETPDYMFVPNNKGELPSPYVSAPFLSRLSNFWVTRLLLLGYKRPIRRSDLYALDHEFKCEYILPRYDASWEKEIKRAERNNITKLPQISEEYVEDSAANVEQTEENENIKTFIVNKPNTEETATTSENNEKKEKKNDLDKFSTKAFFTKANIFFALFRTYWQMFLGVAFFRLVSDLLGFAYPYLLKQMISFTNNTDEYLWRGLMYATIMMLVKVGQSFFRQYTQYFFNKLHVNLVCTMQSAIFKKMTNLSNGARKTSTTGEITNLMGSDVHKIPHIIHCAQDVWSIPMRVMLGLYCLNDQLGSAMYMGLAIILVVIPINIIKSKKDTAYWKQYRDHKDSSSIVLNEIFNGIKVLKLYAWERSFEKKVGDIRQKEMLQLTKIRILGSLGRFLWESTPQLMSLSTFAYYILANPSNVLTTEKVFVSIALFEIISRPLTAIPDIINFCVEVKVSITRIQNFMTKEDIDHAAIGVNPKPNYSITVDNGNFAWDKKPEKVTLKNLNFEVEEGSLVAVVGSVGCGKSSLLSALLGEMEKLDGDTRVKGSIAYVSQQAWIQNQKLQDNILFGKPKQKKRYQRVIDCCALRADLDMLVGGDQTEIGEKGINLSGGQKQRVSLARAAYQNADLYLFDDPLSAVDAHVGKHIFNHVIGPKGMLKNKTRLLVTHAVHVLPRVDKIIVLVDGEVSEMGSYQDLVNNNGAFAEFLKNFGNENNDELLDEKPIADIKYSEIDSNNNEDTKIKENAYPLCNEKINDLISKALSQDKLGGEKQEKESNGDDENEDDEIEDVTDTVDNKYAKLIDDEQVQTGKIKSAVFINYLRSVGIKSTLLFLIARFCMCWTDVGSELWLGEWSKDTLTGNITQDSHQNNYRLAGYGVFALVRGCFLFASSASLAFGSLRGSIKLHKNLLHNLLRYPMSFFDTTPIGRITAKFSSDMDAIDHDLPSRLEWMFHHMLCAIIAMIMVAVEIPSILTVYIPMVFFYILLQSLFATTGRQLTRIVSASRSPIHSHLSESIQGINTIRAFKQQERFHLIQQERLDEHYTCQVSMMMTRKWLGTALDIIGNFLVYFAALFAVYGRDSLSGAAVGLALNFAMEITGNISGVIQHQCEFDNNLVSAEKVQSYSEYPQEADEVVEENRPDVDWPSQGVVEFDNYSTRYREGLDLVIKNVTCKVNPGEKVGIVGRTGAGKSSLTLALFRIIEKATGSIKIDGVDIASIGLRDLRSKLTIIPQDPVLFSGSMRMNLDPFEDYTDEQIWEVLEHAHLKSFIGSLPKGLDHQCSEGGENLSVGQRQLICLARALLRKTNVLVLDEATAAVDLETDELIQTTIRREFNDCTIFTIAHRLNTVIDYNRIMVLKKENNSGEIAEFDSPAALLTKPDGIFRSMAKDAGLLSKSSSTESLENAIV